MFKFLKKLRLKKNQLPQEEYGCTASFLYQDENVKTIYKLQSIKGMCGSYEKTDFSTMAHFLYSNKDKLIFDIDKLSTVIIIVETDTSCFKEVIEVLANTKMTVISRIEENKVKLLFSGSIKDYKDLIKTTKNQSNSIVQGIIEQLYNCNACYFTEFIEDEVMEARFSCCDNSWRSINKEESDIIAYDDRGYIYNLISKYNFTYQDAIKCCSVTLFNPNTPSNCIRYSCMELSKLYHDGMIDFDASDTLLNNAMIVEPELYKEIFTPEYKKFENNDEYYKDIDEILSEHVEEVKDIKREEEMPMITETEDGELEYDPEQFL